MEISKCIISLMAVAFSLYPISDIKDNNHKSCKQLVESDLGYLKLIDDDEAGEKLIVYGQVIDVKTGQSIQNASLFFYQADTYGNYNSTFLEIPSYARIRGKTKTGSNGCFKILTIVPGNYPNQMDGKHIHVIAKAKGYKEWKFEFLFEGWINEVTRDEIKINKDAIILNLQDEGDDYWKVNIDIKLKSKKI